MILQDSRVQHTTSKNPHDDTNDDDELYFHKPGSVKTQMNIYIRMIYKNHTHLLTSGSDILSREGRDVPPRIFSKTEKIRSEKKLMLAAFKNIKISP